ncbi:MAG: hypothetical protein DMG73_00670 [Acidobacteria bacterium]|nr:MAG: hypothetical protein DMG73_00670 [Acidobacteriota bacterium]PYX67300.1 MAG: hypothetical protein DMG74_00690 [Acidobacteriota bacterium]
MKRLVLLTLLLTASTVAAQRSQNEAVVEQKFSPGGSIRMRLSAGDYTISGSDSSAIVVTYRAGTRERLKKIKVQIKTNGSGAEIAVTDTPHNNFHATIEVPRHSDLWVRLTAGDMKIESIEGNKDVEAHAGDLEIQIAHPEEYGYRDASVLAGDIDASAFNISKEGLFRSFQQKGPGKYRLHAHLGAGDLTIRESL